MLDEQTTLYFLRKAKEGSNEAKELLLTHNASLIKCIVKRYLNKGVEYDDLYQLASMGFLKAIAGFDFSYQVKFSTYAVPLIAGEVKRYLRDNGSIKVSRILKKNAKEMNAFISDFTFEKGQPPTMKQIAEEFHMDENEVVFTLGSARMPLSLTERGEYKDEETQEMLEKLPAEDKQEEMIESIQLKDAIDGLDERERKIIVLRYFRDMTQSEVARVIGVSQVQVSRIESRVIERFKDKLA